MDADNKQKSDLGNDRKLNRETNKVTGVKTSDLQKEDKHQHNE